MCCLASKRSPPLSESAGQSFALAAELRVSPASIHMPFGQVMSCGCLHGVGCLVADYVMRGRRHLPSLSFRFAAVVGSLLCGSDTLASRFDPSSSVPSRRTTPATAHTYTCLYGQVLCAGVSLRALPRRPCRFGATLTFCGSPFRCGRRLTPMWLWHASFRVPRGFLQFFLASTDPCQWTRRGPSLMCPAIQPA